ncbi:MAG TPA: glycosyltransferase family 4 protein [Gaiellaceae bacterium]|nr:glycosyltransferase family 4 protein [Gaiellaceae bacterium]
MRAPELKVLLIAFYFPPAGGAGVQRPLKLASHLADLGVEMHVLAPTDPRWVHRDESRRIPAGVIVHRTPFLGPRGRMPAEELYGRVGFERWRRKTSLFGRRLLVPDETVSWALTAIPAALRIVRRQSIDVLITTSPPGSINLVGASVRRATGVPWVADLRDPLVSHPHRDTRRRTVRIKERSLQIVAEAVARRADAVVCVSDAIAEDMRSRNPRGRVVVIGNGADFDDFEGLDYQPSDRFLITHTGSFFGRRDPRPFLSAIAEIDDVTARFVGDFRSVDRDWVAEHGLEDRIELVPYSSHRRSLELQRDSEALLLLIPDAEGRGRHILSAKLFEYLAAGRPILAAVPEDGAAARLIRELGAGVVVAPDDVEALARVLGELRDRWRSGGLDDIRPDAAQRRMISRRSRAEELHRLLESIASRSAAAT